MVGRRLSATVARITAEAVRSGGAASGPDGHPAGPRARSRPRGRGESVVVTSVGTAGSRVVADVQIAVDDGVPVDAVAAAVRERPAE